MITELDHLSKKIDQLAQLVQTLRADNAAMQNKLSELNAQNLNLTERIEEAHDRVSAVLEQAPFTQESV
jgi:chromosome segregation ATPase